MRLLLDFLNQKDQEEFHQRAIFIDFASLPQKPRTPRQEKVFRKGLKQMGHFYGSSKTCVLISKAVPPADLDGAEYNTRPYDERGWPGLESFAARLSAHSSTGGAAERSRHISDHGRKLVDEPLEEADDLFSMETEIERRHFTGRGDKSDVIDMLKRYTALHARVPSARQHTALHAGGLMAVATAVRQQHCSSGPTGHAVAVPVMAQAARSSGPTGHAVAVPAWCCLWCCCSCCWCQLWWRASNPMAAPMTFDTTTNTTLASANCPSKAVQALPLAVP